VKSPEINPWADEGGGNANGDSVFCGAMSLTSKSFYLMSFQCGALGAGVMRVGGEGGPENQGGFS